MCMLQGVFMDENSNEKVNVCVKWYKSKTVIANIVMLVALITNNYAGLLNISAETQVLIMGISNLILRVLTGKPLDLNGKGLMCAIVFATALALSACNTSALNGLSFSFKQGQVALGYDVSSLLAQEQGVDAWVEATSTMSFEDKQKQLNNLLAWKAQIDAAKQ